MTFEHSKDFPKYDQKKPIVFRAVESRKKAATAIGVEWTLTQEEGEAYFTHKCDSCQKEVRALRRVDATKPFEVGNVQTLCRECARKDYLRRKIANETRLVFAP